MSHILILFFFSLEREVARQRWREILKLQDKIFVCNPKYRTVCGGGISVHGLDEVF